MTSAAATAKSRQTAPAPGPPSTVKPSTSDGLVRRASSNRIRLTLQPLKMLEADANSYETAVQPDTPTRGHSSSSSPPNLLALSQLYQERNRMLNLVQDVRPERQHSPTVEPAAAPSTSRPRKLEPMPNAFAAAVEESHNKWLLNSRSLDNGTSTALFCRFFFVTAPYLALASRGMGSFLRTGSGDFVVSSERIWTPGLVEGSREF